MKRSISLLLTMILSLFMVIPAMAVVDSQREAEAAVLSQLQLLKGDGNGFNLGGSLSRSEAATFIVKLKGKEAFVLANKTSFPESKLRDVDRFAWYAPFVEYCVQQKIISGFPDKTFRPNDKISEKAFLSLVLNALGYKGGTDFTWDSVFQVAYSVGLVNDLTYINAKEDNYNYLRGGVVNVLYTSLTLKFNGLPNTVVEQLIADKVITQAMAVASGVIKDQPLSLIDQASASNSTTVNVKFNETVKSIAPANVVIYETDNAANKLTVTIGSQTGTDLVVTTSSQKESKGYSIEITNVEDSAGNVVAKVIKSFNGYLNLNPTVVSDFFKISKITPVSKSVVNVFFTQPINMNSELPLYYEIQKDNVSFSLGSFTSMSVKTLGSVNNGVAIYLKDKTLTDGATYTLRVAGTLTSVDGVPLNGGVNESKNFTAKGSENEILFVGNLYPLDNKTVDITFNKELDWATAQTTSNYSIMGSDNVPKSILAAIVTGDGDKKNKVIRLKVSVAFEASKNYELTMKNVKDKLQMNTLAETKYPFPGVAASRADLVVINATPEDKGTLIAYFDRPVSAVTASTTAYYTITGITNVGYIATPAKVYFNAAENPYKVKIYLPTGKEFVAGDQYKLTVSSVMQDELSNTSLANAIVNFTGSGADNFKPIMYEAKYISKDSIRVRFSEEIASIVPNTLAGNYTLVYKEGVLDKTKIPNSVSLINPTTLVLRFDTLDFATSYTVKFTSLLDYPEIYTRTAADGLNTLGVHLGQ